MYYISFSCFVFTCFDFVFLSQNLNIIDFYQCIFIVWTHKLCL